MRILTIDELRQLDRYAIEVLGIPELVLMENAALAVVDAIGERYPEARRIVIVCGPGNNGADGLAIARQLDARGYQVITALARCGRALSVSAARQLAILEALELSVLELEEDAGATLRAVCESTDLVVDALFGSGLSRPLVGAAAELVETINDVDPAVVSVDLPSGLDGDRAAPLGPVIEAAMTVTFVAPKLALVLPPALDLAGEVVVGDLGFRCDESGGPGTCHLLLSEELSRSVPERLPGAHKGNFGHVLLVAGGLGKAGAAVLAARAAVMAGAGLTTVAMPDLLAPALAAGCPEAMTIPLPSREGGLAVENLERLVEAAHAATVLAIGPGLGRARETVELVRALVPVVARPLVLDADGLNAFEGRLEELAARQAPTVLTPHPGEMARLLGVEVQAIESDRLAAAREAARRSRAVVVLKGRRTIVAAPDGELWINATGNPGMASGGSGDVLTGIVAARLAQGDEASFAAGLSVHLHGLAGDLAASRGGGPAVAATELLARWAEAWSAFGSS